MPFAPINSTNPRTNPWKFHKKWLRIGGAGKWGFFESAILNFLSRPFWIFFCFISVEKPAGSCKVSFISALWMVFPESWKRSYPNFYAHDCSSEILFSCFHRFKYLIKLLGLARSHCMIIKHTTQKLRFLSDFWSNGTFRQKIDGKKWVFDSGIVIQIASAGILG